ncbi:MAG: tRNA pseudouridine(55) synthase TruB [Chloroflexota bacterium]|nr:MAG: tRNA pseudouridine(55) synthase TruB [Chloroflexota bacterium]
MFGIFNICKPAGLTSFDVVARVRRISGERRVGHAGTLDPLAEGVLPICVGQATRIVEYLSDATKRYCAQVVLGTTTDTYDAEGQVTSQTGRSDYPVEEIRRALDRFRGPIEQIPPMYSAVKKEGKRLYQLARAGHEVERAPRRVEIFRIDLLTYDPPVLVIDVECSKGTYIRSLAHDLGQVLGGGAHLGHLVRTRSGPFEIQDALTLELLADAFAQGYWTELVYPLDEPLLHWNAIILGEERAAALRNGRAVPMLAVPPDARACRAYSTDGEFLAVVRPDMETGTWRAEKVFAASSATTDAG